MMNLEMIAKRICSLCFIELNDIDDNILIKPKPLEDLLITLFLVNLTTSIILLFKISMTTIFLIYFFVNAFSYYWIGYLRWELWLTKHKLFKKKHFLKPVYYPYESFRKVYCGIEHFPRTGNLHIIRIFFIDDNNKLSPFVFIFEKKINYNDSSHPYNRSVEYFKEKMNNHQYKLYLGNEKKWSRYTPD